MHFKDRDAQLALLRAFTQLRVQAGQLELSYEATFGLIMHRVSFCCLD